MGEEGWVGWEYHPSTVSDEDCWDGEVKVSGVRARVIVAIVYKCVVC